MNFGIRIAECAFRIESGFSNPQSAIRIPKSKKPAALSPSRRVFPLVAYLRYYRGDRNFFIKSMLEARPRSPLRLRAPNVSAAARLPIL
jgi:hypothetical protein